MKICLLSTYNAPILGYVLEALYAKKVPVDCVLLDSKVASDKDLRIIKERTDGRLEIRPLYSFDYMNIPFFFVQRHDSPEAIKIIQNRKIDICVNAGTPRILKDEFLKATSYGVLNCHPGLLPKYRGACCVEWSILNDDPVGNTAHLMVAGIDEGPIFASQVVEIDKGDHYADVRMKVYLSGCDLIARTLDDLLSGVKGKNDLEEQGEGTFFRPISDEDLEIVKNKLRQGLYEPQTG